MSAMANIPPQSVSPLDPIECLPEIVGLLREMYEKRLYGEVTLVVNGGNVTLVRQRIDRKVNPKAN